MIAKNSFVVYKSNLSQITEITDDKYSITWQTSPATRGGKKAQYATQKVREKDFEVLVDCKQTSSTANSAPSLEKALENADNSAIFDDFSAKIAEAWELLVSDDETSSSPISIDELADLALGGFEAEKAWAFYKALKNTFQFEQTSAQDGQGNVSKITFVPRTVQKIEELRKKEFERQNAGLLADEFIERLKQKNVNIETDAQYLQEIEAFALGKTEKSKYLAMAGLSNKIEKAHKLLLDTGFWQITKNPYPSRYGLSMNSARIELEKPDSSESRTLVKSTAYAIDNDESNDPDDAIGFDGEFVWIHIADPACTVTPDSKIDIDARKRGTTLYMPEGVSRMISDGCFADYALGLKEKSIALSFKIKLSPDAQIENVEVLKTIVCVKRLTYIQADTMTDSKELKNLFEIADKYREKRMKSGAVEIDIPRVDVWLSDKEDDKTVHITPELHNRATEMVKEFMLMAGEAASKFAFKNSIPFPYISTEQIDMPKTILPELAGQFQLLRCMKSRHVGVTPSMHCTLGLSTYCQVTSPLRRYIDLIAHQQLRLFLDGKPLISKDEVLERISTGDAGIMASNKASRSSELHFKLVYLLQNPEWTGKAIAVNNVGKYTFFYLPSLAMETQIVNKNYKLNEQITVRAANINLPELKLDFIPIS